MQTIFRMNARQLINAYLDYCSVTLTSIPSVYSIRTRKESKAKYREQESRASRVYRGPDDYIPYSYRAVYYRFRV